MPNQKLQILDSIGKVFEQSKFCKLESSFFKKANNNLTILADYFQISKKQALFVSVVFSMNYKGEKVSFRDFVEYFDCNPTDILKCSHDLKSLCSKEILIKVEGTPKYRLAMYNSKYIVNASVTDALSDNELISDMPAVEKLDDVYSVIENICNLREKRKMEKISTSDLFKQFKDLLSSNLHIPLVKRVSDINLKDKDMFLYINIIWQILSNEEPFDINEFVKDVYDKTNERIMFKQNVISRKNELFGSGLIVFSEISRFGNQWLEISITSSNMLKECGIDMFTEEDKTENVIKSTEIKPNELFFNEDENTQLIMIKQLLDNSNLQEVQSRLGETGLPTGVAVLFHGFPGTGKTESVYQIARETGREIMKVDISQARSKWYGESEKVIKDIFYDYYSFAKKCDLMPILLLNEADAIITKRREGNLSDVAKIENTIQNIILEELEHFSGILIATTNMVNNLDFAFERRFLFKVEFKKPAISVKAKIWKSKFSELSDSECILLSNSYNFTGGQIQNILKKKQIFEIVNGRSADFHVIKEFCEKEIISQVKQGKIGFNNQNYPATSMCGVQG